MLIHRIVRAVMLAGLLLLSRGELTYASATVDCNPAIDDPTTVDATHSDPMDEVRRTFLLVLRPIGEVHIASGPAADDYSPQAHRPRAPPSA